MVQTTAVVRGNLVAATGSTDFTSSGFGTPSAAIIVICGGNTSNNPQNDMELCVCFWDGTNVRSISGVSNDNSGSASTRRSSDDGALRMYTGTVLTEYTVTNITDGIRITMSVDNTVLERHCTVTLLAGVSATALTFTPNATENLTATSASLGFAPSLLLFLSIGHTVADYSGLHQIITLGLARSDGQHRMMAMSSRTGIATSIVCQLYSETRCCGQLYNDAVSWGGEVTSFGADDFTMTTRDGGSGSDLVFCLALGGDVSFDSGTLTTPTSTGTQDTATTIQPDALMIVAGSATGTSVETGANADGICVGMSNGTTDYTHNATDGDNVGTTNSRSVSSATGIIDVDVESAGYTDLIDATVDSFAADKFTLDFTVVDGTARKGWWLAFGTAAPPAATAPQLTLLGVG